MTWRVVIGASAAARRSRAAGLVRSVNETECLKERARIDRWRGMLCRYSMYHNLRNKRTGCIGDTVFTLYILVDAPPVQEASQLLAAVIRHSSSNRPSAYTHPLSYPPSFPPSLPPSTLSARFCSFLLSGSRGRSRCRGLVRSQAISSNLPPSSSAQSITLHHAAHRRLGSPQIPLPPLYDLLRSFFTASIPGAACTCSTEKQALVATPLPPSERHGDAACVSLCARALRAIACACCCESSDGNLT